MHPKLFEIGSLTIYTYGFFILLGALLCFWYLWVQSKRQYNLTFDQVNNLFLILIVSAIVGGKLFMIFESPSYYLNHPLKLFSRSGFVFYGALLATIPCMLWYFRKLKVSSLGMLDIMAGVACIVHGVGRFGCFFAGCCHGLPTTSWVGVTFSDPHCSARPLNTPLHPTQIYEILWIGFVFVVILLVQSRKKFNGQIFLIYLILYSIGRSIIEIFRGDEDRGFVFGQISNSQFFSAILILVAVYFYISESRKKSS